MYESRWTDPRIAVGEYVDSFDNHCWRLVAPNGRLRVRYDALIAVSGEPDRVVPDAALVPVEHLPDPTLVFALPSRYIQSDLLVPTAWELFGSSPTVFDYDPRDFWDEMFVGAGEVRPYYAPLARALSTLSPAEVERRQRAADLSFQALGITFAVNQGVDVVEEIMPFDLVPRIITADEWRKIERGLEQRVRAFNLFLHDIYHTGKILHEGVVPLELVLGSHGYRRESAAWTYPSGCTRTWLAATWSATGPASSTSWRITSALRPSSRT